VSSVLIGFLFMQTLDIDLSLACHDPLFLLEPDLPKPDFLLIGGAKCGTTSLAAYLPNHPQVAPWQVKEPNYWSWQRASRRQYQGLYSNVKPLIPVAPNQQIAGDYSTSSIMHPMVPRRVAASLPHIKVVVLLRNPIDRAYSHYVMSGRSGLEKDHSFDAIVRREIELVPELLAAHQRGFQHPSGEASHCFQGADGSDIYFPLHNRNWTLRPLKTEKDLQAFYFTSYIFRSIYYDQLLRWLTLFPRRQMLIIESGKFFSDPAICMAEVVSFLGLKSYNFSKKELKRHYAGSGSGDWVAPIKYPPLARETRKLLRDFFAPYNDKLYALLGEDYGWQ
jgi:hypothetical protein